MQENSNKNLVVNSIFLYVRMAITTICALLTTRFALKALGVTDYGLFNVLGGIISFIGIFNTIMLSTSNRFISVAIGRGDLKEINKQFNVNLRIHCIIAIIAVVIAVPIGWWYISRFVNYDGPIANAYVVFYVSIIGSVSSFIGVPYNGVIMAKEKFSVFCITDILVYIVKLTVAWLLMSYFEHKLFIYTFTMSLMTGISTFVYIFYCYRFFPDIVRISRVNDRDKYKEVLGFTSWVSVGAITQVGRDQGASLIINAFFNTAMNAAMGIASSINSHVSMFAGNVVQPMQPQISKCYVKGDYNRTDELLIMSTKFSYLLVLLMGSFFLASPDWLLGLWLDEVPEATSLFLILLIINNLLGSLNSGVNTIIWANGKIGLYQLSTSLLNILSVLLGWFVLYNGAPAYFIIVAYITISFIRFFVVQLVLKKTLNYNTKKLWKGSYKPSLIVTILFVIEILLLPSAFCPIARILISVLWLCAIEWFCGLNIKERTYLKGFILKFIKKA